MNINSSTAIRRTPRATRMLAIAAAIAALLLACFAATPAHAAGDPTIRFDGTKDAETLELLNAPGDNLPSHTNTLTKTGDSMMLTIGVAAAVTIAAIVLLVIALGWRRKQH